jgi:hypothetical protein
MDQNGDNEETQNRLTKTEAICKEFTEKITLAEAKY